MLLFLNKIIIPKFNQKRIELKFEKKLPVGNKGISDIVVNKIDHPCVKFNFFIKCLKFS